MEKERQGDATNEAFHLKLYDDIHNFSFLRGAIWLYYVKLKKNLLCPQRTKSAQSSQVINAHAMSTSAIYR
jgi:hypothetical protein